MSNTELIIDGNNLCYRAYYKFSGLKSKGGKSTSLIFGVPRIIKPVVQSFKPVKVYVVFDGKKSKHRLNMLPDYKGSRTKSLSFNAEDFYHQRTVLMDMLPNFGLTIVYKDTQEADDLIYLIAQRARQRHNTAVILSTDKDFHQLVSKDIWVHSPKFEATLKPHNFSQYIKAYTPEQCVDYLCLLGDDSDNIPGISGMGEKTTAAFFNEYGSVANFLKSGQDSYKRFSKSLLEETWVRNRNLIDLRLFFNKYLKDEIKRPPIKKRGRFDKRGIVKYMHEYDIKTFADSKFTEVFKNIGK